MNFKSFEEMQKTTVFFMLKPANAIYGFILTIIFSFIILFIWASIFTIDDVIKAEVVLRPSENISSIKCVSSGQLYEKQFQNDEIVHKGDLLFRLDSCVYESELESLKKEILKIENDIEAIDILIDVIQKNKKSMEVSNDLLDEKNIKAKSYLIELEKYEASISDLRNKLQREEQKPDALKVPHNIQDLKIQIEQNEMALDVWKTNSKDQALENEKQLIINKNSLLSKIKEIERIIQNSTIIATIDGRITEVSKHNVGDYILAGEEILRITPQNNEKLLADIYVDPSYIAQVNIGNAVKIKFPGLPPSRYGQLETTVDVIPPDVTYMGSVPIFIVESIIDEPYMVSKYNKKANLLPGMTAEARIVTERCTVLQMVLKKLDFIS